MTTGDSLKRASTLGMIKSPSIQSWIDHTIPAVLRLPAKINTGNSIR